MSHSAVRRCVCTVVAAACMLMQNIPVFVQPTVVRQNKKGSVVAAMEEDRGEVFVPTLTVQFSVVAVPPTETSATSARKAEGNQHKQSRPLQQTLQEARFSSAEQK